MESRITSFVLPSLPPQPLISSQAHRSLPSLPPRSFIHSFAFIQFDFSSPSTSTPSYQLVKKLLPPPLKDLFTLFQSQLIEVHGKDLLVVDGPATPTSGGSGTSTPNAEPAVVVEKVVAAAEVGKGGKGGPSINTSTVKVEGRFQISAADLWGLLTDERKVS